VRALALAAVVALAGAGGWGLLRLDWAPPRPTVACEAVFEGTLTLTVPDAPGEDFWISAPLRADRPAAVVQHQIVDANGFGWVNRSVAADAVSVYRAGLPRVPRTHTIRVGVLAPEEAERAAAVARAARTFRWRAWHAARGWLTPAVTPCQTFAVAAP
jgi:hypothetical protein